jgi:phage-related protein
MGPARPAAPAELRRSICLTVCGRSWGSGASLSGAAEPGAAPVRDWLRGLTREARRQIGWDIGLVQVRWPVGRPLVGRLGGGLCEVRTTFDKNEYRVFFYIEREQVVVVHSTMVLVHGIHKKTQKTPAADLALAQRRMKDGT